MFQRANKLDAIGRAYHFIAVPLYYSVRIMDHFLGFIG